MLRSIIIFAVCCGCLLKISAQKFSCQDGPPKGTNPSNCCKKAMSFDQTIFKNCLAQFGNNPPRDGKGLSGPMNGLECVFECILNQTKTIENDKPNAQMLIQKITGALSTDPDWIPVTTAGINYCVLQLNSNAPKIKASLKGDQPNGKTVCSGNSAFFLSCLFTYEFRNCPIKKWTNDTKCNELKGYFNQCPTPQIN